MEKKPNKKEELTLVNNVLKLATKLLKVRPVEGALPCLPCLCTVCCAALHCHEPYSLSAFCLPKWLPNDIRAHVHRFFVCFVVIA